MAPRPFKLHMPSLRSKSLLARMVSGASCHIALREFTVQFRVRDYHEMGKIRPYWCPGPFHVADFFSESKLLKKNLLTTNAYRFCYF